MPVQVPSEAAGSAPIVPLVGDATNSPSNDASPTFENTGDPLLLIGRGSRRRGRDDRVVSFDSNRLEAGTQGACAIQLSKRAYRCLVKTTLYYIGSLPQVLLDIICHDLFPHFPQLLGALCEFMRLLAFSFHSFSLCSLLLEWELCV